MSIQILYRRVGYVSIQCEKCPYKLSGRVTIQDTVREEIVWPYKS